MGASTGPGGTPALLSSRHGLALFPSSTQGRSTAFPPHPQPMWAEQDGGPTRWGGSCVHIVGCQDPLFQGNPVSPAGDREPQTGQGWRTECILTSGLDGKWAAGKGRK